MPVDSKHPEYVDHQAEWRLMRDTVRGPKAVRDATTEYLPMPSGFTTQDDLGAAMYGSYIARARFPDIVAPTVRGMVGLIHRREAEIELPPAMEPLLERTTKEGLTLEAFHMTITYELLRTGRYGVLADAPAGDGGTPFLAGYTAETIINWDDVGQFFVLDESAPERTNDFDWQPKKQWRVLELVGSTYRQRLFKENASGSGENIDVRKVGNAVIEDRVPFVVASPNELTTKPGEIPLVGVARASIAAYQLDADYRHQLFGSGQETLFIIGAENAPKVVGASVRVVLPMGGDAKYVGPQGVGITAHRQAIEDCKKDAVAAGAQLFDTKQSGQESGEALRLRYGAQSATMTSISKTSAACLERALRNVAVFMNLNPDLVVVKPNTRFAEQPLTPADAEALMRLWMGSAISKLTMYENLQRGDIASEERDFEEEQDLIEQDEIDKPSPLPGPGEEEEPDEDDAEGGGAPGTEAEE